MDKNVQHIDLDEIKKAREALNKELGIETPKPTVVKPRVKELKLADDGMIPDKTHCNLDRFILFDLDGTLSEIIDVNVHFTTSGTSSMFATGPLF